MFHRKPVLQTGGLELERHADFHGIKTLLHCIMGNVVFWGLDLRPKVRISSSPASILSS